MVTDRPRVAGRFGLDLTRYDRMFFRDCQE